MNVESYLTDHPDATITEVAFATGLSVAEAKLAMTSSNRPRPSETGRSASQVSELTHQPSDSETPILGHSRRLDNPGDRLNAAWVHKMLRKAGVMDINEACAYLEIARPSIELAVAKGALSCVHIGSTDRGKKLFTKLDLDAYRAAHPRHHYPKGRSSERSSLVR